jgi:hypothetical protein
MLSASAGKLLGRSEGGRQELQPCEERVSSLDDHSQGIPAVLRTRTARRVWAGIATFSYGFPSEPQRLALLLLCARASTMLPKIFQKNIQREQCVPALRKLREERGTYRCNCSAVQRLGHPSEGRASPPRVSGHQSTYGLCLKPQQNCSPVRWVAAPCETPIEGVSG